MHAWNLDLVVNTEVRQECMGSSEDPSVGADKNGLASQPYFGRCGQNSVVLGKIPGFILDLGNAALHSCA
jgi:hypothetical protein